MYVQAGACRGIWRHMGVYRGMGDIRGYIGVYGAYLYVYIDMCRYVGTCDGIRGRVKAHEGVSKHMGTYRNMWRHLGHMKVCGGM
jgi:muconolactone delta-isomerase